MIAGDVISAHARPWLVANRRDIARALVPVLSLGLAWWLSAQAVPAVVLVGAVVYGLAQLALILYRRRRKTLGQPYSQAMFSWLAVGADACFALLLLAQAGLVGDSVYPLYTLLLLRALSSYRRLPLAVIVPFLFGAVYVFVSFGFRPQPAAGALDALAGWGLLAASLGIGTLAIWMVGAQRRVNAALRHDLRAERQGREARITDLEHSANDLRARMRQLHALEEGLRVITSTLSLDEVLNQIVDSTLQMLGSARVHGMVLSLCDEDGFNHRLFMIDRGRGTVWATALTQRAVEQQVPLVITDASLDVDLATIPHGLRAALCVPLFVGEGPAQGALTVVSAEPAAFSSSDARHLTALAMQAGIAIHNAELHSRLRQQQRLLEAVVRDINDGLVVVDARSQIILSNPIGRALLESPADTQPVQSQLLALASSIRAEDKATLMSELHLKQGDEESELVYQAFGAQVRYDDSEEPLVAIVPRDITQQKEEERSRTEFISMVSHELRNPLNSLNGFIKVVLRGQAGALTPLQHEFLAIADSQVEQLKSRIAELLEYNRVEAGRLVLDLQWNDLSLLVAGTATRLSLQAEQAGLALVNDVVSDLPECRFDSERIGQVLNNLIENAIKATPPGGTITLRSELYEDEVWIRVCDTGVGIPADEQAKIFQRFYRAHNRSSSKGNHLGLGLAICQQIVAGHRGRLWVESEEGRGSCFTFALPLASHEAIVNDSQD
jgi:signal transduction histidine kinase